MLCQITACTDRWHEDLLSAIIVLVDYNAHVFKHGDAHG
jgi:hypothetical protein